MSKWLFWSERNQNDMTEGGAQKRNNQYIFLRVIFVCNVVIKGGNIERERKNQIKDEIMKFHAIFITFFVFPCDTRHSHRLNSFAYHAQTTSNQSST